jgi:hypothetical protein
LQGLRDGKRARWRFNNFDSRQTKCDVKIVECSSRIDEFVAIRQSLVLSFRDSQRRATFDARGEHRGQAP